MSDLKGEERAEYVRSMFSDVAPRYDLLNRLMTAGQDVRWRQIVARRAQPAFADRVLDLGTGTGDIAREILRICPSCHVVAADFTKQMMLVGKEKAENAQQPDWVAADGLQLPFPSDSFDAVVSGFLLRNLGDLDTGLREQRRVLRDGGRFVSLDTTPPPENPVTPLLRFHLRRVIPLLGRLVAGQAQAYSYLPQTTEGFLEPEVLSARLQGAGFRRVGFLRLMFGTVAIHWGVK